MSFFGKLFGKKEKETLNQGLEKTSTGLFSKLARIVVGKSTIDDEVLDNLEEVLIGSDVGVATTLKIIDRIQERVSKDKYMGTAELNNILKEERDLVFLYDNLDDNLDDKNDGVFIDNFRDFCDLLLLEKFLKEFLDCMKGII